jgi:hypothetical protein
LHQTIADWVDEHLQPAGYSQPLRNQAALLITGLVAGDQATVSGLSRVLARDQVSRAQEPSIARRILRLLDRCAFDPARVLPALFRSLLPEVLAGLVNAHTANAGCRPRQHDRFRPVRLVIDETSQDDAVHALVIGLWHQGLVLPLAVRVWPQNEPLPDGQYWAELTSMLSEVQTELPPVLRDHVVLVADRGYGHARFIDLVTSLGWAWVVRCTGQVRVQWPDGREQPLRELVAEPGQSWQAQTGLPDPTGSDGEPGVRLALFKKAGWRQCWVVGMWLPQQSEPWLLMTNRAATAERLQDYARRWAIERLFLSWKSHGWHLEAGRVRDAARVGRLISGLVVATWWRFAAAQPAIQAELDRLAGRRRFAEAEQLPLPLGPASPLPPRDRRPWPAKFSLLTWGWRAIQDTDRRRMTPPLTWSLPAEADFPAWPQRGTAAARGVPT